MSTIIIRGQKPIKVSETTAITIKEIWDDEKYSALHKIKLDNISTFKGEIKYIAIKDDDDRDSERISSGDNIHAEAREEYQRGIRERLVLSPQERAKLTAYFELQYFAFTGQRPSVSELNEAIMLQVKYFTEHPKDALPDPFIFKELIEKSGHTKPLGLFQANALQKVERSFQNQ